MSVLISGSIAYDTILSFDGRFADSLHAEAIAHLNLTFPASAMRREFGGCAANVAYALKCLGGKPLLWSAMGKDAAPYMKHLEALGISTFGLKVLDDSWMPQAFITTDASGNQLTTFHGGAMDRTQEVPFPEIGTATGADGRVRTGAQALAELEDLGPVTLAMLSPGGKIAMGCHAEICVERGIPYIFDVGQAAPLFSGEELRRFIERAYAVAFSDYEAELIERASGLSPEAIAKLGKIVFHTHGARGSSVWLAERPGARRRPSRARAGRRSTRPRRRGRRLPRRSPIRSYLGAQPRRLGTHRLDHGRYQSERLGRTELRNNIGRRSPDLRVALGGGALLIEKRPPRSRFGAP